MNCYSGLINTLSITAESKHMAKHPNLLSFIRPVLYRKDLPVSRLPENGSVTDEIHSFIHFIFQLIQIQAHNTIEYGMCQIYQNESEVKGKVTQHGLLIKKINTTLISYFVHLLHQQNLI
jgi:hypothetical protein